MSRNRKIYDYLVSISVVDGCFTSDSDLEQYIKYRLGLRSKDSDKIVLISVSKLKVTGEQEVFL